MKKKLMKFAALALAAALTLPALSTDAVRAAGIPMSASIRIGLTYGSDAVPGANLLNSTGSGYRLGYYDDSLNFVQLGYTTETGISVVKTQNVWYGPLSNGLSGYTDTQTSSIAVGCYHIQLPGAYSTFEEASAAAVAVPGGFPAWTDGTYTVRLGAYLSSEEANTALTALGVQGAAVCGTSSYGVSVVKTGTSTILFQFDGGASRSLGVMPGLDNSVKTLTWYAKRKYYGGFRYQRVSGGNLTVVNVVDREDYINCVISQEMSPSWPVEALKAQAVTARSYAASCTGRHTSSGFDLCATTHCQAYPGAGSVNDNTYRAAQETSGQYVWYNGSIAETYYFSSDGGATESAKNVWGGNLPYLVGVEDPWEATVVSKISNYNWSYTFTADELAAKLRASGRNCGTLAGVRVSEYTANGNVRALTFTDTSGSSWTITGCDNCRIFLGVNSPRFTITGGSGGYYVNEDGSALSSVSGAYAIDGSGNVSAISGTPYVITGSGTEVLASPGSTGDSFTVSGTGNGHNVGMSQWGAYAMAQAGKTYVDILKFYYTGVEIR